MINILMSRSDLLHEHIKPHLKTYIKPGMKVCVIAYSFFNDQYPSKEKYEEDYNKEGKYYTKVIEQLIPFGIKEDDIKWVKYFSDDYQQDVKKITQADLLFLPGGAPELFMQRIHEKGLNKTIAAFNKTVIGISAGAMIQLQSFHISPDQDYHAFSMHEGLGFVKDMYVEVHFRRRRKQKASMRRLFRKERPDIYVIPDDGCLVIENNHLKLMHTAKQYYDKNGVKRL